MFVYCIIWLKHELNVLMFHYNGNFPLKLHLYHSYISFSWLSVTVANRLLLCSHAVLTYRHELGMNYNFIRPDLIVGSCLQVIHISERELCPRKKNHLIYASNFWTVDSRRCWQASSNWSENHILLAARPRFGVSLKKLVFEVLPRSMFREFYPEACLENLVPYIYGPLLIKYLVLSI